MRRVITYTTADGKRFEKRRHAVSHEISLQRRQRISECLCRLCKVQDEKATCIVGRVVDFLNNNTAEMMEVLSSRAAARAARNAKGGSPPSA